MSAVSERSELIREVFLTPTKNDAGINAFRLYIRGKPWVVVIDDKLVVYTDQSPY